MIHELHMSANYMDKYIQINIVKVCQHYIIYQHYFIALIYEMFIINVVIIERSLF